MIMRIVMSNLLLVVDAVVNLILGGLLIWYPKSLVDAMGLHTPSPRFFSTILGGVLVGIGVALILEDRRTGNSPVGIGLGGAIAINLCGATALAASLLTAQLSLTPFGGIFLWGLVLILVIVSGLEWANLRRTQ
jgi:hypothetical protein